MLESWTFGGCTAELSVHANVRAIFARIPNFYSLFAQNPGVDPAQNLTGSNSNPKKFWSPQSKAARKILYAW